MLTPGELVCRAASRGVSLLALTDHDETGGLAEAGDIAAEQGVRLVPGVEISSTWEAQTIHVVGLDIDAQAAALVAGLASIRDSRASRASMIAAQLEASGIPGSLAGAMHHAGNASVGRSHFARFLVERKYVRNSSDAFRLWLGSGRPGYVPPVWPDIARVVEWIHAASGQAVLAHPDRYRLSPRMLRSLFETFANAGGDAIEVNAEGRFKSSAQVRLAREFGFALSAGSDFHAPGKGVPDVGDATAIPADLPAVWQRFRTRER